MKELIEKWKNENIGYETKYEEPILQFLNYIEEIQDFSIFQNVYKIHFHFYGDFGNDHMLEVYYRNEDNDHLDCVYLGYSGDDWFEIDLETFMLNGPNYIIHDYKTLRTILSGSETWDQLNIPTEKVSVKTTVDVEERVEIEITSITKK